MQSARRSNYSVHMHDTATTWSARCRDHSVRTTWRPLGPYAQHVNHAVLTCDAATTQSVHSTRRALGPYAMQRNVRCIRMHNAGPTPGGMGISHLACWDAPNSLILFMMQLLLWRVRLSDKQRSDAHRNHVVDEPTKHLRVAITILMAVSVHLPPKDRLGRVRGYRLHPALAAFHRRHHRHHRYHHQNHRLPASPISTCPV